MYVEWQCCRSAVLCYERSGNEWTWCSGFLSLLSVSHPSCWEVGLTSSVGQGERIGALVFGVCACACACVS